MPETLAPANSPAAPRPNANDPRPQRWVRWLLGTAAVLALAAALGLQLLDPWLRRTLEQQVAAQTHGQYRLRVGELRTSLWQRAVRLSRVRLRPAATVADTLPRLRLDVARLHVTGVGLWALLRKGLVPVDSVVLDSVKLEVLALAGQPAATAGQPLHTQLPLGLKGLGISYFGLLHAQANYHPAGPVTARFRRADLSAWNLLIGPAGDADTQRLGYAAAWRLHLRQGQAAGAGHRLRLGSLTFSTAEELVQLDSVAVMPSGPTPREQARVHLVLPRLRISGLSAAALLHQRQFRADSLLLLGPQLTLTPPAQAADSEPVLAQVRRLDLGHFALRQGYLRVAGTAPGPVVRGIALTASGLHFNPAAAPDARRVFFAKSWDVALGRSEATVAAHAFSLGSLRLSTSASTFAVQTVRIRPPGPGRGQPGGVRVDLTLPQLVLTGLDAAALQRRQFTANSLVLNGPSLDLTPPSQPPPPVWKLLATFMRRSEVATVRVRRADIRVRGVGHTPEVHGLNLTGRAIRIDSLAALEPTRIAYARGWLATTGLVAASFDAPYYRASSQRTRLDTNAKTFRFENLALTPNYSPVGMNQRKGYQAPAITIHVPLLSLKGLNFAALAQRSEFRAAQVAVQSPVVRIASDGRGPINPNRSKVSPEEMLKLPVVVDVRRLDIRNGNLYSSYRSPLTPGAGTLSINRFAGSFVNLSNDPRRQTAATPLTGKATTYLQNRCRLDAQVSMYLLDPRGRHRVQGVFGPGPFAMLNSMTVPTRLVRFKSGEVRRLRFDLQASRQGTTGTMWAEYSGLQMTLLSYKAEEIKKTLFSRLKSKAANVVVIRDQNPRKRGALVTGEMTSTREPRFSVFTLWRQGVVSGLFHSVGVPQQLAQKLSESKDEAPLPK